MSCTFYLREDEMKITMFAAILMSITEIIKYFESLHDFVILVSVDIFHNSFLIILSPPLYFTGLNFNCRIDSKFLGSTFSIAGESCVVNVFPMFTSA